MKTQERADTIIFQLIYYWPNHVIFLRRNTISLVPINRIRGWKLKPVSRVHHERLHMQDVLTKQIAVRGDPSLYDYIIELREGELFGNHDPVSSVRFVHLASGAHNTRAV